MQVVFGSRSADGKPMRDWSVERVSFALRRLRLAVPYAKVRLADANGPRGGVDKSCQIEIQTVRAGTVVVTSRAPDWRTALDMSLSRAIAALRRALQRDRKAPRTRNHKQWTDATVSVSVPTS
jgi:hypothetical protein